MEIVIRCLGCHATTAQGGLSQLLTQDEALNRALHNPGCPINRPDHRTMVHTEEVTTLRPAETEEAPPIEEKKTVYTLLVFPAYRD